MFGMIPFGFNNHDLFDSYDDMFRDFFGDHNNASTAMTAFRTDIRDLDNSYMLEADLPGFNKEDISVDVNNNILTIRAEHNEDNGEKDEQGSYIRRERRYGSFTRSFDVSGIDEQNISAAYENGVLKVTMPKLAEQVPTARRIEIA